MNSLEDIVQTSSAVILRGKIELQIMVNSHHISTLLLRVLKRGQILSDISQVKKFARTEVDLFKN